MAPERRAQHLDQSRAHEAAPVVLREGVVAQVRALERAAHDLVQVHDARERAVRARHDQVPDGARGIASDPGREGGARVGRRDPGAMEVPAPAHGVEERPLVAERGPADPDARLRNAVHRRPPGLRR
jgi:hypothetical protein